MNRLNYLLGLILIQVGMVRAQDSLMVAHWPMNEGVDTVITDLINGNNGAMIGLNTADAWLEEGGVSFDNLDGHHIEVPHADSYNFGNDSFTISMLVRYQDTPMDTDRWIIKGTHGSPGTGSRFEVFRTSGNTVRFAIDNGQADIKSRVEVSDESFITGDWVHVVAVRDTSAGKLSLFANGMLIGSGDDTSGDISNGEPLWIGESTDEDGTAMSGDIREVRLYNYALGKGDIDTLFESYGILGTDAYLSAITLDPAVELIPAFDSKVFNYTAELPTGTESVNVSVETSDENATVTGEGSIDVSSGSGLASLAVTAENGIAKNTYNIAFTSGPPPLAFPGADGYGKYVTGGRGGAVYEVTNLKDDGLPGSLRYAIEQSGPRTIVFRVSGNIELTSTLRINNGDLTIAGQTAPGEGICLKNEMLRISASNVIIRYIRCRLGENWGQDALGGNSPKNSAGSGSLPIKNIIIDHCSISYGADETLSVYDVENLTIQWCIISESMNRDGHGYGGIMGGWGASLHHTLFAHHKNRSPRFCGARYQFNLERELMDMRYNVIYNGGKSYGGEGGHYNLVNNYYKKLSGEFCNPSQPNPSETDNEFVGLVYDSIKSYWYVDGNYVFGNSAVNTDNWNGGVKLSYAPLNIRAYSPFESAYIGAEETAGEAYINVLQGAGATLPARDVVDARVVEEVLTNTGSVPNTLADIPGEAFPVLNSLPAPDDSDHDGMPDDWEETQGLDPNDPSDRNLLAPDGYTLLEKYLNSFEFRLAVEGISLNVTAEDQLQLFWAETFLGEEGYIIERSEAGGEFVVMGSASPNVNSYVDSTASLSTAYNYRVKAFNAMDESLYSDVVNYDPVSVEEYFQGPVSLKIYPNPVDKVTYLEFELQEGSLVEIALIDINGAVIRKLPNAYYGPGTHILTLDVSDDAGSALTPGLYICTWKSKHGFKAQKFTVIAD